MDYIKGNYKKAIFSNDQGFTIGLFKVSDTNIEDAKIYINRVITFTGYFHELNNDDLYCFYGQLIDHPKYGMQFNTTNYERLSPEGSLALEAFFKSDLFKGVGDKLAKNIVNTLGEDVINEILKDSSCLLLVPKMTIKKANSIYETLKKYEQSHQVIVYLTKLGFSMKDSLSIYNFYKEDTTYKINLNPYILMDDLNISFLKIDEIALNLGVLKDDSKRVKACILYTINDLTFKSGDTYLFKDEIYNSILLYLNIELNEDVFDFYINELIKDEKVCVIDSKYYLKEMYDDEVYIASFILNSLRYLKQTNKKIDKLIEKLEIDNNISYNDIQKYAIKASLENNVTIITGGPGTGKTTIIKAITTIYQDLYGYSLNEVISSIALLAPTGRASRKISENTLLPSSTIHRFLKWNKDTQEFMVSENNKDNHKLIIIDEVSMIDTHLMASLFRGLKQNVQIIFVGDFNQLPSVGAGNVLKDLIESEKIETIYLKDLYRQNENSYIPKLAREIIENNLSEDFLNTKSDYTFLKVNSDMIINTICDISYKLLKKGYDYKNTQFLAPMYATVNGIDNLNKYLQNIFNPQSIDKNEVKYSDVIYRENDKVLQLVNMPDEGISNGDIGIIKNIIKENNKTIIYIDFDGSIVKYETKDLNKIKHGYIISIHKSQGSEFDLVVIPICPSYKRMLYKKLIYTAVTRAKKKLILVGDVNSFIYAVNNDYVNIRKTTLLDYLNNN